MSWKRPRGQILPQTSCDLIESKSLGNHRHLATHSFRRVWINTLWASTIASQSSQASNLTTNTCYLLTGISSSIHLNIKNRYLLTRHRLRTCSIKENTWNHRPSIWNPVYSTIFWQTIMRLHNLPTETAFLSTLLFPLLSSALGNLDCTNIVVDKKPFNLEALGGPRSALHSVEDYVGEAKGWTNTTYTIDLCNPIVKKGFYECPGGTRGNVSPCFRSC